MAYGFTSNTKSGTITDDVMFAWGDNSNSGVFYIWSPRPSKDYLCWNPQGQVWNLLTTRCSININIPSCGLWFPSGPHNIIFDSGLDNIIEPLKYRFNAFLWRSNFGLGSPSEPQKIVLSSDQTTWLNHWRTGYFSC